MRLDQRVFDKSDTISLRNFLVGIEGNDLNVTCSLEGGPKPIFDLRVNGTLIQDTGKRQGALATLTGTRFVYGPLNRTELGFEFVCDDGVGNSATAILEVYCKSLQVANMHTPIPRPPIWSGLELDKGLT